MYPAPPVTNARMSPVYYTAVSSDERRAQLRYARALLERGRYGEILRRTAAAVRLEVERLIGRTDEQAYRRWLAEREADTVQRWKPPAPVLVSLMIPPGPTDRHAFTIRSVERQSYGEWEVVLGHTLDEMLGKARGQFVAMLAPGDSLLPRALEL